jgi:hypothetical protein
VLAINVAVRSGVIALPQVKCGCRTRSAETGRPLQVSSLPTGRRSVARGFNALTPLIGARYVKREERGNVLTSAADGGLLLDSWRPRLQHEQALEWRS